MIVYYIVLLSTLYLLALDQRLLVDRDFQIRTERKTISFWKLFLILIPLIFIFGMRSAVGDTVGYYSAFKNLTKEFSFSNLDERAVIFSTLQKFCKSYLFESPELWLLTIELLSMIPIIYSLSKYSVNVGISIFVFFASTEFTYLLNGARQFVAVCIMFYAFKFIVEKKPIKYYLCLAIASGFHLTALVMLPAYFFARLKTWRKSMVILLFVLAIACFFSESLFEIIDENILQDSVYAHYSESVTAAAGVNIFRVLVSFVPVALAFIYRKNMDYDNMVLNACVNLSALNAIAFLFASTMGANLTGRLTEYYNIYNLLLYPYIFENALPIKYKKVIKPLFIIAYLFFFYYQMEIAWGGLPYESNYLNIFIK